MHGWLILDKPLNCSSAQVVGQVKRLLKLPKSHKIGHGGTLDPLASGILPLAIGEATKTVQFVMDHRKGYRFQIAFGEARSTDDAEGEIVATSPVRPSIDQLRAILPRFTGRVMQAPPAYSAIKVDGQRAYALARAGEAVELAARGIYIDSIDIIEYSPDFAMLEAVCGKGTYIRSLARDMAESLGTVGYVSSLRRTRVGKFDESHAISLEKLEEMVHKGCLASCMHPVESVLDDIPARELDPTSARQLRNGQVLRLPGKLLEEGSMVQISSGGVLIAVCEIRRGMMKPVRVFNLVAGDW